MSKPFRYSPQRVFREAREGVGWKEVATYDDATIRDAGDDGWTGAPQAMIRAYSNDVNFYGDEEYQSGNGIGVWTQEQADEYDYGFVVGAVYDCDGDLALKRILMTVLSKHNHGHGHIVYTGLVSEEDGEYTGWGGFQNPRMERWTAYIPEEETE